MLAWLEGDSTVLRGPSEVLCQRRGVGRHGAEMEELAEFCACVMLDGRDEHLSSWKRTDTR